MYEKIAILENQNFTYKLLWWYLIYIHGVNLSNFLEYAVYIALVPVPLSHFPVLAFPN